jgi:small subunit ribosomal protein S23e
MRGLYAAGVLRRKSQFKRRCDHTYRKRLQGKRFKSVVLGKPQAKGIVLKKVGIEAKQPNSAVRKVCKVQIIATGKNLLAFAPQDGAFNVIQENDQVTIEGLGKKGRATGDMPGIKYKIIKVAGVSLDAILSGKKEKPTK